ncbi:class I SAM-dependent methyltransferase [Amycolatopsis sp. NPDC023774]|uniref:class I SAM-dependent methyltransferase n=1 Tax=Amycolatopsis sp. NPDC023774 TaxID=3155015 RepID=UPI0033E18DCB
MPEGTPVSEWLDPTVATSWLEQDSLVGFLVLPRRIAATLVAGDRPRTKLVADIGSGPGDFLEVLLDLFPGAHGIWTDVSTVMEDAARARLSRFGDRVSFRLTDMTNLAELPGDLDVVMTSRASHHLEPARLARFYTEAAEHLAPGGWLLNLDHVGPAPVWDARLRAVRKQLIPPSGKAGAHKHNDALPSVNDHLEGLAKAGFADVEMPWRGLYTCLLAARRDG